MWGIRGSADQVWGTAVDDSLRAPQAIGWARLAGGTTILTVLGYTYGAGAMAGRASLMNFFGFFTNSTNLLAALIFIVAGVATILGYRSRAWLADLRAIAVTSLIVVGVGYNALPGVGTAPGWVSVLLHAVVPVAVTLDWLFVGDRRPVAWSQLWLVLPYPVLWLAMIQYRWATDQWVPYWYVHPSHGPLTLGLRMGVVLAGLLFAAVVVWMLSRFRGLRLPTPTPTLAPAPAPAAWVPVPATPAPTVPATAMPALVPVVPAAPASRGITLGSVRYATQV